MKINSELIESDRPAFSKKSDRPVRFAIFRRGSAATEDRIIAEARSRRVLGPPTTSLYVY